MIRRTSPWFAFVFAALLAFAQQQAVAHALEHDFERIHQTKSTTGPDESVCAKCLAIAHLDHADSGAPMPFAPAQFATAPLLPSGHRGTPRTFVASYLSRGPPRFS